jgi:hypothetical protein
MIIIGVFTISKENLFPGWWAIIPTFGAALIISAGTKAWINRTVLSNRVLVWFGLISFPLYLWHWPLLSFAHILENGLPSREIRIVAIVMSILLAWLTYKIIEKPIRLGMHNRIKIITLVTIMVIVGYIGNYSFQHNGLIFRNALKKTEVINPLINDYPHKPFHNQICSNIFPQFEQFNACLISKNKNPDVLIVGDSHSNQYYQSLAKKLPNHTVMNISHWRCLPFSSKPLQQSNNCINNQNTLIDFILANDSIKTIIVTGFWSYLASGDFKYSGNFRTPIDLKQEEAISFQKNGNYFFSKISNINKDIIFIYDIPDLDFDIKSCFISRPFVFSKETIKSTCALNKNEYEKRYAVYNKLIQSILNDYPKINIYNPKNLLCDDINCWAIHNGQPLYYNGDHLTLFGTDFVIDDFLKKYPIR